MEKRNKQLDTALDKIQKAYGKGAVMRLGDENQTPIDVIPTGSISLNAALGIGGLPKGRIIEIYGDTGSSKTSQTLHLIANCQAQGGICAFIDMEHALDPAWADKLGVDIKELYVSQPNCISTDSWVLTNKGYTRYKYLTTSVASLAKPSKFTTSSIVNKIDSGYKDVYEVKTTVGKIKSTLEHKYKVFDGYKELNQLNVKDYIAVPLHIPTLQDIQGRYEWEDGVFLGLLLADGSYSSTTVNYFKEDVELLEFIQEYLNRKYPYMELVKQSGDSKCTYRIVQKVRSNKYTEFHKFVHTYLGKFTKQDKRLLFDTHKDSKSFLYGVACGMVSGDGSLSNTILEYTTISEHLKNLFIQVMYDIGIPFSVYEREDSRKSSYQKLYRLVINSKEGLQLFKTNIGIVGRIKLPSSLINTKKSYLKFPPEFWSVLFTEVLKQYSSVKEFSNVYFKIESSKHLFNTKRRLSYEYVYKLNQILKSSIIDEFLNQSIRYVPINSITPKGLEPCFDLTISETHNFVCNNYIVHNCGEDALEVAEALIRSGAIDLLVVDSVAALTPKSEIEREMGQSNLGVHARLMSQGMRKLTAAISKSDCCVVFINQTREAIGVMFGSSLRTTGGNALKFYASIRLQTFRGVAIKEGTEVIGHRNKVKVVKNKLAPPFKTAEFDFLFSCGIDYYAELRDIAVEQGVIEKKGSYYKYEGTSIAQGASKCAVILRDNPELSEEIEKKLKLT